MLTNLPNLTEIAPLLIVFRLEEFDHEGALAILAAIVLPLCPAFGIAAARVRMAKPPCSGTLFRICGRFRINKENVRNVQES